MRKPERWWGTTNTITMCNPAHVSHPSKTHFLHFSNATLFDNECQLHNRLRSKFQPLLLVCFCYRTMIDFDFEWLCFKTHVASIFSDRKVGLLKDRIGWYSAAFDSKSIQAVLLAGCSLAGIHRPLLFWANKLMLRFFQPPNARRALIGGFWPVRRCAKIGRREGLVCYQEALVKVGICTIGYWDWVCYIAILSPSQERYLGGWWVEANPLAGHIP